MPLAAAKVLLESLGARSCEIWLWEAESAGGSQLRAAANAGSPPSASPPGETHRRVPFNGPWEIRSLPDGGSLLQLVLGQAGFARLELASAPDATVLGSIAAKVEALGERLLLSLPSIALAARLHELALRNEFDRAAARAFTGVDSIEQIGRLIEQHSARLFRVDYTAVYLLDPLTSRLRLAHSNGFSEEEGRRAESTAAQRHPGQVVRTGQAVDIADTSLEFDPLEPPGHGRPVRSRLFLPVRTREKIVGAIGFASSRPHQFDARHRDALEYLADLAGITYERLQAQLETRRRGRLIESTSIANERLLAAVDWRESATAALALVGVAIEADAIAVARIRRGDADEQVDFVWQPVFGVPWPHRDRIAQLTASEIETLSRGESTQISSDGFGQTLLLKPIIVTGALWGVLACETGFGGESSMSDAARSALRALAGGFAAAIDRARLDDELRRREQLGAVSKLATGIAHDFNNLLWPVLLYSEILERTPAIDDRTRQMLKDIRRSASRASELVQQIFAVARSKDRVLHVVDLPEIAIEVTATARRSALEGATITAAIDNDAGHVLGDEELLRRLLLELMTDAVGSDDGSPVSVRLELVRVERDRGSWVRISVTDDREASPTVSRELSLIRRIVTDLGGECTVRHGGMRGTEREVLLPIVLRETSESDAMAQPASASPPRVEAEPPPAPEIRPRILLVDDDASVLEVARQILESLDFEVLACGDPRRALALLEDSSARFSLLLTDLAMPGLDGLSLARESKRLRPSMPVVCCTGFGDARSERIAGEIGVAAFLRKPIDFDHYASTIRAAIGGPVSH